MEQLVLIHRDGQWGLFEKTEKPQRGEYFLHTKTRTIRVICPHCGQEHEVHPTPDPEIRDTRTDCWKILLDFSKTVAPPLNIVGETLGFNAYALLALLQPR